MKELLAEPRPEFIRELGSNESIKDLMQADVIFGADQATGNKFLVFGRSMLQEIITTGKAKEGRAVTQPLLQSTLELEAFLGVVTVVKGFHEYQGSSDAPIV
jgi:hypothetical protein